MEITKMGRKKRLLEKHRKQVKKKNRAKNKIARKSRKRNRQKVKITMRECIRTARKTICESVGLPYNIIFGDSKGWEKCKLK